MDVFADDYSYIQGIEYDEKDELFPEPSNPSIFNITDDDSFDEPDELPSIPENLPPSVDFKTQEVVPSRKRKSSEVSLPNSPGSSRKSATPPTKKKADVDFLKLGGRAGPEKNSVMDLTLFNQQKADLEGFGSEVKKSRKNLADKFEREKRTQAVDHLRRSAYCFHSQVKKDPAFYHSYHDIIAPVEEYFMKMYHRDIFDGLRKRINAAQ